MKVQLTRDATKELKKLKDPTLQKRLVEAIEALGDDPRPPGCKALKGYAGGFRVRVGDWRIVYEVKDEVLLVLVVRIGHRREVYQ